MSDEELCKECKQSPSSDSFMIQCDHCNCWYHGRCCSLNEWQAAEFEIFHCRLCVMQHGPSKRKRRENWHRHDCFELGADNKPIQCGTISFLKKLKSRRFPDAYEVVTSLPDGSSLSKELFLSNGFRKPFVINNVSGLNMRIPETFTIQRAVDYLGENCRIDIIDSERQLVFESTLGKLRDYFATSKREKIYNVISLEFTGTKMEEVVTPPYVVRELSWLPSIWPSNWNSTKPTSGNCSPIPAECPRTERFLLVSAAGSYTDFHIDFGGSSVWYHIIKGSKVFYLSPPTEDNLNAYEKWNDAKDRVDRFLGDEMKPCYKLCLNAGQTLLLPGGWIHSVITPSDSVVFGGNFLHSLDIALQLRIFELEHRIHTDSKFLFPEFVSVNFLAAKRLSDQLKDLTEDDSKHMLANDAYKDRAGSVEYVSLLIVGCMAMLSALRRWITDDKCMKNCQMSVAECSAIAADLQRSIRLADAWKASKSSNCKNNNSIKSKVHRGDPLTPGHQSSPSKRCKEDIRSSPKKEATTPNPKATATVSSNAGGNCDSSSSSEQQTRATNSSIKLKIHIVSKQPTDGIASTSSSSTT